MTPTFGTGDELLTITNTVWTNSSTGIRSIFYYPRRISHKKETKFEKKRRLETKQQKRDRLSLDTQMKNRFQFNELKPRIKTIVTRPKMMIR